MRQPTFKINHHLLGELRLERGLTQLAIGCAIAAKLGLEQDEETSSAIYRRIERTGRTSRERALAIAEVLEVSLERLQGHAPPEPADYVAHIRGLLQHQVEYGNNVELCRALEREKADNVEAAVAQLASNIAERIEVAQLGRNPSELKRLAVLTGLSEEELLRPANVHGYWFISVTSRFVSRSDIVLGSFRLMSLIQDIVGDRLNSWGSDNAIRIWRDDPWYRIEISMPRVHELMRIDCVRTQPDGKGLRWVAASWWDDWWLREGVGEWAQATANFVQAFDAPLAPADVRNLRLLVTEYQGKPDAVSGQIVLGADLAEGLEDARLLSYQSEGISHQAVVHVLGQYLHDHLHPRFTKHPSECWTVMEFEVIQIMFYPTVSSSRDLEEPFGLRYSVCLVEETEPGKLGTVPWRQKDRADMVAKIKSWLS